jgi:hypothetical protein
LRDTGCRARRSRRAESSSAGSPAYSSQSKNNCFTETYSGSEAGSYSRPIDFCLSQL